MARFGDSYRAYCREVPRAIPTFTGLLGTLSSMHFHWRRVIVKEYGTPCGWVGILTAVTLYNFWSDGDWERQSDEIAAFLWIAGITTAAWFIAWRVKRASASGELTGGRQPDFDDIPQVPTDRGVASAFAMTPSDNQPQWRRSLSLLVARGFPGPGGIDRCSD